MSEMVERVAKSIFEVWSRLEGSVVTWDEIEEFNQKPGYANAKKFHRMAMEEARAAIEAMREPTKAMTLGIAAADWQGSKDLNWSDGWRIMIDEALK